MDLRRKGSFCGVKRTSALRHTFSPPPIVIDKLWLNTIYTLTSNGRHYGFLNYRFLPIEIGYKVGLSLQWSVSSNSDLPIGTVISLEDNTVVWWLPSAYCSLLLLCFISPRVYQQEECHLLAWVLATERAIEQQRVKTYLQCHNSTSIQVCNWATMEVLEVKCIYNHFAKRCQPSRKWDIYVSRTPCEVGRPPEIRMTSLRLHVDTPFSYYTLGAYGAGNVRTCRLTRISLLCIPTHLQVDHVFKQIWCQGAVSISSASILLSLDLKRDDL